MKIEIILPDQAIAGTLTYMSVENGEGFLCNAVLNGLDDGNVYDTTKEDKPVDPAPAGGYEPDIRADGSVLIRPKM